MRKLAKRSLIFALLIGVILAIMAPLASAQFYPEPGTPLSDPSQFVEPEPCTSGQGDRSPSQRQGSFCPNLASACVIDPELSDEKKAELQALCDSEAEEYRQQCAFSYDEWLADKNRNFWVEDPEITSLGKGGERSRQFLLWVLTHQSIDDHPTIFEVWRLSQNVALFFILIVAIVMGIGIIISQRNNFKLNIEVWPLIIRLAILLVFILFSAQIVLLLIKLSDVMMEFFIRTLGVRELFNIFFIDLTSGSVVEVSEQAYREFIGCTNWNASNTEMVTTSKFLVRFTNMTYYFLGIMMILRKVVLWFLLIVSPFLAILAPFVFIRNIGWIWVGVFFQWIFYGPLFALFIGALAKIWNSPAHIPFVFDFSRTHKMAEAIYPTSINILYGGPAQTLGIWNTSNYVDTFAEYIISLVMLWTVLILPWWLLRIFRDYCCDGIYAMKNILLSMYDTMRSGGGPGPAPSAPTLGPTGTAGLALNIPKKVDTEVKATVKLETVQEIKQAKTESIVQSVSMRASNLTEIARVETNKVERENVRSNLDKIQNPYKAETPTERQKLMNIRDEIKTRAAKGDQQAQKLAAVTSRSRGQQQVQKQQILQTMPQMVPVIQNISVKFSLPKEKTRSIVSNVFNRVLLDNTIVTTVSEESRVPVDKTKKVLQSISQPEKLDKPTQEMVAETAQETGLEEEQVKQVIQKTAVIVKTQNKVVKEVAQQEQVEEDTVQKVADEQLKAASAPEENIEQQVPQSQKVSIEDYEEVKKMWQQQYESGEIPVSENIQDREEWVQKDKVSITNILNKVMSKDKVLQEQGLDEVGFILPIFMINNLSGEELLVYLKAKLEAAKQVERDIKMEAEIREKIQDEEDIVEIEAPKKKTAAKTQTLSRELEIEKEDEPEAPGTPEVPETPKQEAPNEPAQSGYSEEELDGPSLGQQRIEELKKKLEGESQ